ncbi:hypothetical protein JTE90_017156 [Oedothorax gibbosus]|uniref:Uncharacterized protein n=1 Tax=Oedothorax gibbosus TaxID=931172 RepID=A0AAV6TKQ6_9ARAC|nr:hypothetical protein JTE90_017156 [Oedothorax gibbosus]
MTLYDYTLRDYCLSAIAPRLSSVTQRYALPLPPSLQRKLFYAFDNSRAAKYQETLLAPPSWLAPAQPESCWKAARLLYLISLNWKKVNTLPRDVYAFFMQCDTSPATYLGFARKYHVVTECYVKTCHALPIVRLCHACCAREKTQSRFRDRMEGKSTFQLERMHDTFDQKDPLLVAALKDTSVSWCAHCVTTPLFRVYRSVLV